MSTEGKLREGAAGSMLELSVLSIHFFVNSEAL